MTGALSSEVIARAFLDACEAELAALKPGNVHVYAGGHRMETRDFELSAAAAAPHIATPALKVGMRIRRAVDATFDAVGCNTNLGIVLLSAPLAAAAEKGRPLRVSLSKVLATLDRDDAAEAFAAIRRANPAGLGKAKAGDVSAPVTMTLREAMGLAAARDRIARAYVTDYEDVFALGLPSLADAVRTGALREHAITALHMAYLAAFPDSHIARKHGVETAEAVREAARHHQAHALPPIGEAGMRALLAFDRDLKSRGLNPGTTADLVVATLFADTIISLLERSGA